MKLTDIVLAPFALALLIVAYVVIGTCCWAYALLAATSKHFAPVNMDSHSLMTGKQTSARRLAKPRTISNAS